MGNNNHEAFCTSRGNSHPHPKVHSSMCNELSLMLDKVSFILPSIERAQPGCKAGIEELSNLYNIVDKGKLVIQNCMECSSLYLAITGEAIAMRCERIRLALRRSLFLIQNMVESVLANEVDDVHNDLGYVKFIVDPEEEEAGKAIHDLLRRSEASQELELQTFLLAASKLNLRSPRAILNERRAIKKLLVKVNGTDPKKEGILKYFLYLVRKYGKNIKLESVAKELEHTVDAANEGSNASLIASGVSSPPRCFSSTDSGDGRCSDHNNSFEEATPPLEFCCPMSKKLMVDPVIIESGQTYERENIERWFSEGNDTCPRTGMKLQNFTVIPNTCMKAVISNWCKYHELQHTYLPEQFQSYSVSSLYNVSAPLVAKKNRDYMIDYSSSSPMNEEEQSKACFDQLYSNANYQLYLSFRNFNKEMFLGFLHELSELPVELQSKAIKDLKNTLNGENQIWDSMVSNGFLEAFHDIHKNDSCQYTMQAQKVGIQIFLAFISSSRIQIPSVCEDVVRQIALLLDSKFKTEAFLILHELLQHPSCKKSSFMTTVIPPSVSGALDTGDTNKCLELALKIICKLSSDNDKRSYLISSGIISKLSPLLAEGSLTECCLNILRNLSEVKEASELISRTGQCVSFISDHLENGSTQEQEHAVVILLAVCSLRTEDCSLAVKEIDIPALVGLFENGSKVAKDCSSKLLQLLRDFRRGDRFSNSISGEVATNHVAENLSNGSIFTQPISSSARYISRKFNIFSKPRSLTLV